MNVLCGNAADVLKTLPEHSADCCVTSPPYYNLRDYGIDGQIGLEKTPEQYVEHLLTVFQELKRVLKPDGTFWLNIADSYAGSGKGKGAEPSGKQKTNVGSMKNQNLQANFRNGFIKPKDMIGIPWMLAFALRNDGWYLRSDIIWHKPNAMPNPVQDRPVNCYEHVFLFSKSHRYYFDYEAIKEPVSDCSGTRRCRDVWSISKSNFRDRHYAAFPVGLAEKCILAGCPENGTVLDMFCGSGTTGVAALKNHRHCVLIDISPEYCDLTRKRLKETEVNMS